jgi:hypothetical protein
VNAKLQLQCFFDVNCRVLGNRVKSALIDKVNQTHDSALMLYMLKEEIEDICCMTFNQARCLPNNGEITTESPR